MQYFNTNSPRVLIKTVAHERQLANGDISDMTSRIRLLSGIMELAVPTPKQQKSAVGL
jgi:hypothetical protein